MYMYTSVNPSFTLLLCFRDVKFPTRFFVLCSFFFFFFFFFYKTYILKGYRKITI